jgi:hypothetical protein
MIFKLNCYCFHNIINQLASVTETQYALCVVQTTSLVLHMHRPTPQIFNPWVWLIITRALQEVHQMEPKCTSPPILVFQNWIYWENFDVSRIHFQSTVTRLIFSLLYKGPKRCNFGSMFISHCKIALHFSSETCRVILQWVINILPKLHLLGPLYNIVLWCTETQI